ncbi:pre-piRNA 3'-exonuclease trimmer-like isoform X2 [Zootermopsis nevadensis]|uniref:pre-piRNA 3'-exonuclease trimmer-like isoform X2 n=1 Tax=Zootermopsis nevadensis TaxID=136037 RepID=UPI000B8E46C0|nr:pre-piRNA 3'-exonuclease trimmer-like isoform X2 [Zootermopsis nevadensis]
MSEITRNNFEQKYPKIVESLRNAVFIAVDTEFTGLLSDPDFKASLFDTSNERYDKLRRSVQHFIIMQIGICTFRFVQDKNKYEASRYTFYIFPKSFASVDNKFMCQASSLEFLCQHDFDFNKFVYEGVPYLNQQQEAHLRKQLNEGSLFRHLERTISLENERSIQLVCSRVAEWSASAVLGDVLELSDMDVCKGEKPLAYVVHKELRQRFPNVWTFPDSGFIRVQKISEEERKAREGSKDENESLEADLMDSLLGFSRLFKLLVELQKPIVGHNFLMDLMIMYSQFHEQLPSMWESNILSHLYHFFKEGRGRYFVLFSPVIEIKNEAEIHDPQMKDQEVRADESGRNQDLDVKFHEAGWDSFCTGYCFIRLAHIFAHVTLDCVSEGRMLTSRELLSGAASKKNCVNLIRASVSHICLDGPDPASEKPQWIHVQTKTFQAIDISKVAELFARFGAVDVKPFTRFRALVAVGNCRSASDIVTQFQKHRDFNVSYYHPIRHSPVLRGFLWTGLVVSGGIFACLLFKEFDRITKS